MLQAALRSDDRLNDPKSEVMSDPKLPSLAKQIEAEFPIGARLAAMTEPTATSMAERFAPQTLRARREEEELPDDAALARLPAETPQLSTSPRLGVLMVLTGVAIAPVAILGGLLWFGDVIHAPELVAHVETQPASHEAAVAPAPTVPTTPTPREIALTAPEEIMAKSGDRIAFPIDIDAPDSLPARSVIAIRDLPDGASFSGGRPFGSREWSLAPDETSSLTLQVPRDHTGSSDLAIELVAADGAVLARTATRLEVAPSPTAGFVVRSGEEDRIDDLIAHGDKMIAVGYFAGARAYYQRAAEAGSGEAALAVGATYDPAFISALRVQGIKPDRESAQTWYARASALGVADRAAKLASLKQAWIEIVAPAAQGASQPPAAPKTAGPTQQADEEGHGPLGRLVAAATELAGGEEWVVVSNPVNVRAGPSSSDERFKVAEKGAKLRVVGREGNWVQISDPDTEEQGWIYKRFLEEANAP
jgi:hypothetical protein